MEPEQRQLYTLFDTVNKLYFTGWHIVRISFTGHPDEEVARKMIKQEAEDLREMMANPARFEIRPVS
jgi:hypothetical protein